MTTAAPAHPTLASLGAEIPGEIFGRNDAPIQSVSHDSRVVEPGALYACLRGRDFDGHDFAGAAVAAGAIALLTERPLGVAELGRGVEAAAIGQLVVDDARRRLGPLAAAVYGHPSRALHTIGVTGTNGKTTTTQLLAAVLRSAGFDPGLIGTLHGTRTTPEAPELQQALAGFVERGNDAAVLEVSSHALALHRADGTSFDAVVFTNLGRDHLDLHGTQEEYMRAKARLFDASFSPLAVINVDDPAGQLIADTSSCERVVTYAPSRLDDVHVGIDHHRYRWRGRLVEVPLGGRFNVANSLAALVAATELGIDPDTVIAGLATAPPVPGRFDVIAREDDNPRGVTVVVDYAHTPDGLAELLAAARQAAGDARAVLAVIGAGGERDHDKRPEMGEIAAALADRVVVTSDNPRREDPVTIIDAIVAGTAVADGPVDTFVDRRAAIEHAVAVAARGDVVVIAGKGHETTQDLGDRRIAFDDRAVARAAVDAGVSPT
ncbi:MAG: UDP-N-acetylmuramoyl-L-alanyl-D-glutamate--2,6-diaminopimelate ligase [Actinomycetota bacterium]